ncbi:acyl carrier protein [Streptomyces sp. NPDC001002]
MDPFTLSDLKRIVDQCVGTDGSTDFGETGAGSTFSDLGLDSLAVYEVVTRIQDERGVTVPDEDLDGLNTPRLLVDFVNRRLVEASARG